MIPLALAYALLTNNTEIPRIEYAIWTGQPMFMSRISAMAKTWFQLVHSVNIYVDSLENISLDYIKKLSSHINLSIHVQSSIDGSIFGTSQEKGWSFAQFRHIDAISDLLSRDPPSDFYVFGDDDTFFYPDSIMKRLLIANPSTATMYGRCHLINTAFLPYFSKMPKISRFPHGGAGLIISRAIRECLKDKLRQCGYLFPSEVPSDVRLASCIYRHCNHNLYEAITSEPHSLHGSLPHREFTRVSLEDPPMSYHQAVGEEATHLWNASISTWWSSNGTEMLANWADVTLLESIIPIESGRKEIYMMFGYDLCFGSRDGLCLKSTSKIEPVFVANDRFRDNPIGYMQTFERGIKIHLQCDKEKAEWEMEPLLATSESDEDISFSVGCPKPEMFINNFPNMSSVISVVYERSDNQE